MARRRARERGGGIPAAPRTVDAATALAVLQCALAARAALLAAADGDVARLCHGAADGLPGLVIERFGPVLVAQLHEGQWGGGEALARTLCAAAAEHVGAIAVYLKQFVRDRSAELARVEALHTSATPWIGTTAPEEYAVCEHGVRFRVRPYDGYSVGLFLEHRPQRQRVRTMAAGRRVLNLFAYTCGFSVVAALGGAAETVSVDVAGKALDWGRRNFAENGLSTDGHWFMRSDAREYCRRAARQGRQFDLIVLDPPSFARVKQTGKVFVLEEELARLVAAAVEVLAPGGDLLLCTNNRSVGWGRLEGAVRTAAEGRPARLERLPLAADFAGDPDYAKALLARLAP
jgi:23S rRNA (cytosine1962-C5)-methyltransferase